MYKKPAVLGTDAIEPNVINRMSPQRRLEHIGNTGNLLFAESLYNVLRNAVRCSYHFMPHHIEGCDVIVIAGANWINSFSDFAELAKKVEATNLPVVISGIGAQVADVNKLPEIKPGTLRLLKIASERSKALSVRGNFSCEVLNKYGIKNAVSTGCPSLLLAGKNGPKLRIEDSLNINDTVLHSTRHAFLKVKDFQAFLYREAIRLDVDILLQSELADMFFLYDTQTDWGSDQKFQDAVKSAYGADIEKIKSYLHRHGKVFDTLESWMQYLASKSFCVGSRVHGTIASLLSGTPATLIAHDSRTEEMSQQMGLPYILEKDVGTSHHFSPIDYYDTRKFHKFIEHYPVYRNKFIEYFDSVGLPFDKDYAGVNFSRDGEVLLQPVKLPAA